MSRQSEHLRVALETLAEYGVTPRIVSEHRHVKIRWEIGARKFQYSFSKTPSDVRADRSLRCGIRRLIRSTGVEARP